MPANYDSTLPGALFRRFPTILINYPTALTASIRAEEVDAVKTTDGSVLPVRSTRTLIVDVAPSDFATVLQLVDPTTGANIPGGTMTVQALMLGMLAFLRKEQLRLDALEANPPE